MGNQCNLPFQIRKKPVYFSLPLLLYFKSGVKDTFVADSARAFSQEGILCLHVWAQNGDMSQKGSTGALPITGQVWGLLPGELLLL